MLIKTIYIHLAGDHSTGIGSEDAIIEADGDFLVDTASVDDGQKDWLSDMRESFMDAFKIMWGEKPQVTFDFELKQGTK